MAVKLICASHSPLMEFATPQEQHKEQAVRQAFDKLSAEVEAYNPTLIIIYEILKGIDSFNKLNGSRFFIEYISGNKVTILLKNILKIL